MKSLLLSCMHLFRSVLQKTDLSNSINENKHQKIEFIKRVLVSVILNILTNICLAVWIPSVLLHLQYTKQSTSYRYF